MVQLYAAIPAFCQTAEALNPQFATLSRLVSPTSRQLFQLVGASASECDTIPGPTWGGGFFDIRASGPSAKYPLFLVLPRLEVARPRTPRPTSTHVHIYPREVRVVFIEGWGPLSIRGVAGSGVGPVSLDSGSLCGG